MSKALLGAWLLLCLFMSNEGGAQTMQTTPPIRVLIVTGGHDFEREPFFEMFRSFEGIRYEEVQRPHAHARLTPAYGRSRVVYIQLGHDHYAYENPNYRRLVWQAIRWVAGR